MFLLAESGRVASIFFLVQEERERYVPASSFNTYFVKKANHDGRVSMTKVPFCDVIQSVIGFIDSIASDSDRRGLTYINSFSWSQMSIASKGMSCLGYPLTSMCPPQPASPHCNELFTRTVKNSVIFRSCGIEFNRSANRDDG